MEKHLRIATLQNQYQQSKSQKVSGATYISDVVFMGVKHTLIWKMINNNKKN